MNYIVLDLEWNQPRCAREMVESPVHLVGEIVQIGAVRLNRKFSIKDELRLTVNPKYYRKMHRKVAKITGLDSEDLKKGVSFPEAYRILADFCGKDFVFLTWGPDDLPMLRDNMNLFSLDEEWLPKWYDLQVLFSHQILGRSCQMALEDAIEMLGEEPFQAHDALCDAKSTALICRHLDMKNGLEAYPRQAGDITINPLDSKELSLHFLNRGDALSELGSTLLPCPACEEYLLPEPLVPQNVNKYLTVAECSEGHRFLVRFRLYKDRREAIRVIREIFPMDPILEEFFAEKKERHQKQKEAERLKERKKRIQKRMQREALIASAKKE